MKRARVFSVHDFKHQEDLKTYSQLPYYDDLQGYDLGVGGILSQIAHKIYANSHNPSWKTLKHHLFMAKIPKKRFRDLKAISGNDKKKNDFKQERMFGRASKIPAANTSNELDALDFADYGNFATFLHIHDAFPR